MHILLILIMSVAFLAPQHAYAKKKDHALSVDASYDEIIMPELFSESVLIDNDEEQPIEPNIAEVKYRHLPEINGISERIDRLIQGIKVDIPPEYDHYGHEIRRHMVGVGNMKIFEDEEYLIEQIKHTRKAKVIAKFWKKHLDNEMKELSEIVENDDRVSFANRTAFKQNKLTTRTFLISLTGWIDTNEAFLMEIFNNKPETYEVMYPEIIIKPSKERLAFYNKLTAKQFRLKEITKYRSFSMMVY